MHRAARHTRNRLEMGPTGGPGSEIHTHHLSEPRRRLLRMMQKLGHGRIRQLPVDDGEPVLDPPPKLERIHLFGRRTRRSPRRPGADFVLKNKLVELFEIFDRDRTFVITELVVEDGLPVRMTVAESASV